MRENRGPWYLLTGLLIGLLAGLAYAWIIDPVQYMDVLPGGLKPEAKDDYRVMIALAYQADANLGRARQRLALLNDSNPAQALMEQSQRLEPAAREAKALLALADAYNPRLPGQISPTAVTTAARLPTGGPTSGATPDAGQVVRTATASPSAVPTLTPTITPTPRGTLTPRPTVRPSPTLGAPFAFKDKQQVCNSGSPALLQVEVLNSAGQPVPGVAIRVTWGTNNSETFYTGLIPDMGLGYADFQMAPKIIYGIQAGENGETVNGLSIPDCSQPDGRGTFQGGWKIKFAQP